jgi:glycerol-3-phosphate dehydrogenase
MVGGKWTTFRAFAQQASDLVLAELGAERRVDTKTLAIGGGAGFTGVEALIRALRQSFGITETRAAHLVDLYGCRATEVMTHCAAAANDTPLADDLEITAAELTWLIQNEEVVHLSDIVLRRTPLAITGRIDRSLLEAIAAIAAAELGWSAETTRRECRTLEADLSEYHGVTPRTLTMRTETRSRK